MIDLYATTISSAFQCHKCTTAREIPFLHVEDGQDLLIKPF